jgi:hypothetical protein
MTDGAADADVGPRRLAGSHMALLGLTLLLVPPVFVFAPLAGLLAAARPSSGRARLWTVVFLGLTVLWAMGSQGLLERSITAWAVLTAGIYAMLMLRGGDGSVFGRAALAVALGAGTVLVFLGVQGISWEGLEQYARRALAQAIGTLATATDQPGTPNPLRALQAQVPLIAALQPAQLALSQMAGCLLAWHWHAALADRPLLPAPGRFAAFRFADEWIWAVIVSLAALLFGATGAAWTVAANLLAVMAALYTARGAAVLRATSRPRSPAVLLLFAVLAIFLFGVLLAGCLAVGLADTWLDFRRRSAAADQTSKES